MSCEKERRREEEKKTEELNVQHSTFNIQRRIEEILNKEEMKKTGKEIEQKEAKRAKKKNSPPAADNRGSHGLKG